MAIGFLLVGPVPFVSSLETSIPLIKGSTAILGTGYALVMVSTIGRAHAAAIRNGYNDDLSTYMFVNSKKKNNKKFLFPNQIENLKEKLNLIHFEANCFRLEF